MTALAAKPIIEQRIDLYQKLMLHAHGRANDAPLAAMIATWMMGGGVLPAWMGLSPRRFQQVLRWHFPRVTLSIGLHVVNDATRQDEVAEIRALLLQQRARQCPSELWLAEMIAVACLGQDHLWQDLGLWSRAPLTELMQRNFPALAALNTHDMKWKKFLYRQLCTHQGLLLCRAPSCAVCVDYHGCFGPEH